MTTRQVPLASVLRPAGHRRSRRRRFLRRALPLLLLAGGAFAAGAIVGGGAQPGERRVAVRFAQAWERGDTVTMYDLLTDGAKRRTSAAAFRRAYRSAASTATQERVRTGAASGPENGVVTMPVAVRTRVFGTVRGRLRLPVEGDGEQAKVAWAPALVFPGLRAGEELSRRTELPRRADILARDGTPIAEGDARTSALGASADAIKGSLGDPSREERRSLRALGYPRDTKVGVSGLERVFETRLAGMPGGELLAGARTLAVTAPRRGEDVRSSIDPEIQRSAVAELGNRLGAVAVMRPSDGQVLGLSGVAFSALQPPGSTFKIVTATAALEARAVKTTDQFPYQTATTIEGFRLENANGESCGGTFVQSFAESCNSVFAPLGAKVGARKLVATAERFGFNEPVGIPGAATSTIPSAQEIGDDLAVGSSAIGQGEVQATTLAMTSVAATIGNRGTRVRPTLERGGDTSSVKVTDHRTARTVRRLMVEVVKAGTGTAAAIPGVTVAGKTGTSELRDTRAPAGNAAGADEATDTDAWFVSFAPARKPRVAVGVLLISAGGGGDVAAPVARQVLLTALAQ